MLGFVVTDHTNFVFPGQRTLSKKPEQRADILTGLSLPVFLACVNTTISNCGFAETSP